jgi:hypothetical protein
MPISQPFPPWKSCVLAQVRIQHGGILPGTENFANGTTYMKEFLRYLDNSAAAGILDPESVMSDERID